MHKQYRVNFPLLIGLAVGTLVASGAAFGLWKFQINRNAGGLVTSAKEAEEAGDLRKAGSDYANYLSIRSGDEEVRVKLAGLTAAIADLPDATPEEISRAVGSLEATVRSMPEQKDLQRKLVDLYGRLNGVQQAIDHLNIMVSKYPDDPELQVQLMQYLMRAKKYDGEDGAIVLGKKLVGYDDKSKAFDAKKAPAVHEANVYGSLALLVRRVQENTELADEIMTQMIKENPDSAEAFLQRGQYLVAVGEPDRGQRDIDKAYKLAPKDADVLLTMAQRAQVNNHDDQARKFLEEGNKEYPKDPRFYQGLASLEVKAKNYEMAQTILDDALKQVSRDDSMNLLLYKAELQFLANDVEGARATAQAMRQAHFAPVFVEWIEARILLAQNKWFAAAQALQNLPQNFVSNVGISDDINNQLGICYERLGQLDRALNRYQNVLQRNPANEPAKMGEQRILAMMGRGIPASVGKEGNLDDVITKIMEMPKDQQNWTAVDAELTKLAEKQGLKDVPLDLFWARVMLARDDYAKARQYLVTANSKDPENLAVQRMVITVLRVDPSQGPDKALKRLDSVVEKFGDQPGLRLDRADLLLTIAQKEKEPNLDALKAQLVKLSDAPADWNDNQKTELWNGMAGRFLALKMQPEATANLQRVATLRPDELPTVMAMFSLALEANDDAGIADAQDRILKIVGSKNASTYQYAEARRLLSQYRRGQLPKETLTEVRSLTDRALKQRPDWFELHLVKAELEMLEGNNNAALQEFDTAAKLGRPNPTAILQHVRLLLAANRVQPAKELIEKLPKEVREGDLGQLYAEVLFNLGDMDQAAVIAEKFAAAAPDNAERQLHYGQLLARFALSPKVPENRRKELLDKAGAALKKASELGPESAETWLALISFAALQKDADGAQTALQQAQLNLPEDQLIAVLAKAFEILGGRSWFDAETMYLTLYSANPDNLQLAQQLAMFYMSPSYPVPDKGTKAAPLVNKILHGGADGKLDANDPTLTWARRAAAELLANSNDYQQLRKATNLLASNSRNGELFAQDRLLMARILAGRPEPASREQAAGLLEQLQKEQPLSLENDVMLGQLYFAMGDTYWDKCKTQMRQTVAQFRDSAPARATFADMLIRRGSKADEFNEADRQLKQLQQLAPNDIRVVQYTVQLADKTGKKADARNYLLKLVPNMNNPGSITEQQVPIMEFVAGLLGSIGDYDSAEKIYRAVVATDPRKAIALANFLGEHRNVDEAFTLMQQNYKPESVDPIARTAISVIRTRRDEIGDKYDKQVQQWLDRALLENPDSIPLLMLQAEFDDVRKEYTNAAATYQKLLAREDLTGVTRAIVLNNLAFLVSLSDSQAETGVDPLKLVQEAAQILGPTADILDTRAVVYSSKGEYQKAINDLEYSVTDTPTSSKYFHKAVAHIGAGENKAAVDSWIKAEQLGDIRGSLNRMEYGLFDQTKAKIDALRNQNPKLTDADKLRAAG